jgi:hypothetical protein
MVQIQIPFSGSALKDQGINRAIEHAESENPGWTDRTLVALREFCADLKAQGWKVFTLEEFRSTRFKDPPASHHAWGALASIAARRGIIKWAGEYRNAVSPRTHSHPVRVWETG